MYPQRNLRVAVLTMSIPYAISTFSVGQLMLFRGPIPVRRRRPYLSNRIFPASAISVPRGRSPSLALANVNIVTVRHVVQPCVGPIHPTVPRSGPINLSRDTPVLLVRQRVIRIRLAIVAKFRVRDMDVSRTKVPRVNEQRNVNRVPPIRVCVSDSALDHARERRSHLRVCQENVIRYVIPSDLVFSKLSYQGRLSKHSVRKHERPCASGDSHVRRPIAYVVVLFCRSPSRKRDVLRCGNHTQLLGTCPSFSVRVVLLYHSIRECNNRIHVLCVVEVVNKRFLVHHRLRLFSNFPPPTIGDRKCIRVPYDYRSRTVPLLPILRRNPLFLRILSSENSTRMRLSHVQLFQISKVFQLRCKEGQIQR